MTFPKVTPTLQKALLVLWYFIELYNYYFLIKNHHLCSTLRNNNNKKKNNNRNLLLVKKTYTTGGLNGATEQFPDLLVATKNIFVN